MGFVQWFLEKLASSLGVFQSHLGGDDVVFGWVGAVLSLELDAELVIFSASYKHGPSTVWTILIGFGSKNFNQFPPLGIFL